MQTARQTKRLCGKMPPSARKNHSLWATRDTVVLPTRPKHAAAVTRAHASVLHTYTAAAAADEHLHVRTRVEARRDHARTDVNTMTSSPTERRGPALPCGRVWRGTVVDRLMVGRGRGEQGARKSPGSRRFLLPIGPRWRLRFSEVARAGSMDPQAPAASNDTDR